MNLKEVMEMVEAVGRDFTEPDEDWEPCCLAEVKDGSLVCLQLMLDDNMKKVIVPVLAQAFQKLGGIKQAFLIISQWALCIDTQNNPNAEAQLRAAACFGVKNDPERVEVLALEHFDGQTTEVWDAKIQRFDELPPRLGPWKRRNWTEVVGHMANVLQRAFELAKEQK